jgi:excisionase family DNA binding protein
MSNNIHDRWLSRGELADRLGLPTKTLARWASKGTGPLFARMGRHVRYRLSDVLEWEAAQVEDQHEAVLIALRRRNVEQVASALRVAQTRETVGGTHDDSDNL